MGKILSRVLPLHKSKYLRQKYGAKVWRFFFCSSSRFYSHPLEFWFYQINNSFLNYWWIYITIPITMLSCCHGIKKVEIETRFKKIYSMTSVLERLIISFRNIPIWYFSNGRSQNYIKFTKISIFCIEICILFVKKTHTDIWKTITIYLHRNILTLFSSKESIREVCDTFF